MDKDKDNHHCSDSSSIEFSNSSISKQYDIPRPRVVTDTNSHEMIKHDEFTSMDEMVNCDTIISSDMIVTYANNSNHHTHNISISNLNSSNPTSYLSNLTKKVFSSAHSKKRHKKKLKSLKAHKSKEIGSNLMNNCNNSSSTSSNILKKSGSEKTTVRERVQTHSKVLHSSPRHHANSNSSISATLSKSAAMSLQSDMVDIGSCGGSGSGGSGGNNSSISSSSASLLKKSKMKSKNDLHGENCLKSLENSKQKRISSTIANIANIASGVSSEILSQCDPNNCPRVGSELLSSDSCDPCLGAHRQRGLNRGNWTWIDCIIIILKSVTVCLSLLSVVIIGFTGVQYLRGTNQPVENRCDELEYIGIQGVYPCNAEDIEGVCLHPMCVCC